MKYETCIRGKDRTLVGRPVFKTGGGRQTSLVGSIPTLFRPESDEANSWLISRLFRGN